MMNPVRNYQNSPLAPSNGRVPSLQENPERFFLKMCLELAMVGIALLGVRSQNHLNRSLKWRKSLHHWKIKILKMRICSFCQRTNLFGPLVVLRLWDWLSPRYGMTYPMLSMHSVAPWNLLHRKFVACYKHWLMRLRMLQWRKNFYNASSKCLHCERKNFQMNDWCELCTLMGNCHPREVSPYHVSWTSQPAKWWSGTAPCGPGERCGSWNLWDHCQKLDPSSRACCFAKIHLEIQMISEWSMVNQIMIYIIYI